MRGATSLQAAKEKNLLRVHLKSLTRNQVHEAKPRLLAALGQRPEAIELDFAQVAAIDSAGVAAVRHWLSLAGAQSCTLQAIHVHPSIARSLALFPAQAAPSDNLHAAQEPWIEQAGQWLGRGLGLLLETLQLVADLSHFAGAALRHPRRARWNALWVQMEQVGVNAVTVVGLIAFLVGVTVAMQSAAQLRQFGANVYVVDLVAVAITRELGPLMAAIVVAGRSGAAAAAEIATMVITEEIDALRTMGIHPVRYVVLPKLAAILVTQPLLSVLANAIAIFGSFFVALFYLDIAPGTFADRLREALELKDILLGLLKSCSFGGLIMVIAALVGLRTRGGADAVGRSTTTSVVAAIFAIIVADAAFSLLFYLGD